MLLEEEQEEEEESIIPFSRFGRRRRRRTSPSSQEDEEEKKEKRKTRQNIEDPAALAQEMKLLDAMHQLIGGMREVRTDTFSHQQEHTPLHPSLQASKRLPFINNPSLARTAENRVQPLCEPLKPQQALLVG